MLNAMDAIRLGGSDVMPAGPALGRERRDEALERAEAIRRGRAVEEPKQLEARIRGVAEDFVSVFMSQVMRSMRATVPENPAMHGDNGEKFFQEMLDSEQAKTLAGGRGYGLTELVYQSLLTSSRLARPAAEDAGAGEALAAGAEDIP